MSDPPWKLEDFYPSARKWIVLYHPAEATQRAVTSARRATELATDRYRSGIVAYIEVVDTSRDALMAERANAQLAGQRLIASVQLIKALGGGWSDQQLSASVAPVKNQLAGGR